LTGNVYLLGGQGAGDQVFNDVWQFDLLGQRWNLIQAEGASPFPRTDFASAALLNGRLVLFGGARGQDVLDDFWLFETRTNVWRRVPVGQAPEARAGAEMAYAVEGDSVWLFGGRARAEFADLWRLPQVTTVGGPTGR
jgi:N-acetylneuraminic acid mutarotase